jgi:2-oxoglutarate dehydrogenase E1 component
LQVCNLTTPAQLFHAIRRQMHRSFRKPLVVMSPKSLLRHKLAVSRVAEFTHGAFRSVIDDIACDGAVAAGVTVVRDRVTRVLLCSGKVYYDLLAARAEQTRDDVAIVRLEQLYPFPAHEVRDVLDLYPNAEDVCWVQEEPQNMGAWDFVYRRVRDLLPAGREPRYVGREDAASPATGSYKIHQSEQVELVTRALSR